MRKDTIYSMRLSKRVLDALRQIAGRERRTVASLLDKIIADYLESEGFSTRNGFNEERRRFPRKKITLPGTTVLKAGPALEALPSVILDLSQGGVLLTYPKGSDLPVTSLGELPDFQLQFTLPPGGDIVQIECHAQRMSEAGSEIQVGATFRKPEEDEHIQKLKAYLVQGLS
jgi:hypothetical protein